MTLGCASGEGVSVMGSLFPENYDVARDAFLNAAVKFVQANKGTFTS